MFRQFSNLQANIYVCCVAVILYHSISEKFRHHLFSFETDTAKQMMHSGISREIFAREEGLETGAYNSTASPEFLTYHWLQTFISIRAVSFPHCRSKQPGQ